MNTDVKPPARNTYRDNQIKIGKAELRGLFVKKELHKHVKLHIKHIIRLIEKGIEHDHISDRLARIDLED